MPHQHWSERVTALPARFLNVCTTVRLNDRGVIRTYECDSEADARCIADAFKLRWPNDAGCITMWQGSLQIE